MVGTVGALGGHGERLLGAGQAPGAPRLGGGGAQLTRWPGPPGQLGFTVLA